MHMVFFGWPANPDAFQQRRGVGGGGEVAPAAGHSGSPRGRPTLLFGPGSPPAAAQATVAARLEDLARVAEAEVCRAMVGRDPPAPPPTCPTQWF